MLKIAAFGFRSIPLREGCAGADKFAIELFPRLAREGNMVTCYNRLYPGQAPLSNDYHGVKLIHFRTIKARGFDTLWHSFRCTLHIIFKNTGKIIHIQNGGNSVWALFLRLAGKKVYISQDGIDWKREKWPWYGKLYLNISKFLTAYLPNKVIFDNIFAREYFEKYFNRRYDFIPFGSDVPNIVENDEIFSSLGIEKNQYFLFIGRFIPDKGLHYLIKAFENVTTSKKLVLVGGSPNPSDYEKQLHSTNDPRIVFVGYVYGNDSNLLIRNSYCYIQPSDVEGLSPVILSAMSIGAPIICSDIKENIYAVSDHAILFKKGNSDSLKNALENSLANPGLIRENAIKAQERALKLFNWDNVVAEHIRLFKS